MKSELNSTSLWYRTFIAFLYISFFFFPHILKCN